MGVKAKTSLPAKPKEGNGRLGQKYGVIGDELNYTVVPPKVGDRPSEADEDLMATLQKVYDLFETEPGLTRELKDKVARTMAKFYHQEEPGFTVDEAYKTIIRDYHIARDIPDIAGKSRAKGAKANRQPRKTKPAEVAPLTAAVPPSAVPKGPTIQDIMSGRPFSPGDFKSMSMETPQRKPSQRQSVPRINNSLTMASPGGPNLARGYRPMMVGFGWRRPPSGRFRPPGFFMGPVMPLPGFYGHP